jgi:hypothetical protein
MNCGADVYIEKPFSMKYLEASVRQLLEMRRLLRSKFSHTPLEPIAEIASTQVDNAFLERMSRIIEENVANPDVSPVYGAHSFHCRRYKPYTSFRNEPSQTGACLHRHPQSASPVLPVHEAD